MPENRADAVNIAERRLRTVKVAFFGALAAVAASLALLFLFRQTALPTLTRAKLDAAQALWESAGVRDYDIAIDVVGPQTALYEVTVRDGEATSATLNGRPLTQARTWSTWSVPGMFGTVTSDMESLESKRLPLVVRCEFHARYGYPERYQRIELGGGSEVTWRVTKFEVLH